MGLHGLHSFLRIKFFANLLFRVRFFYFIYLRRNLREYGDTAAVSAHKYSVSQIFKNKPQQRILKLILPLATIESLNRDSKILAIGCRFEADLIYLMGYGFRAANVRGLDMVSYSPWVDLGNMHAMSYADNSWDAVLVGWTLSYSTDPELAAREMLRVVRPGGVIAIGVSYYPPDRTRKMVEANGYLTDPALRLQTSEQILNLFSPHVDQVYFRHDPDKNNIGSCLVIFSVRKPH